MKKLIHLQFNRRFAALAVLIAFAFAVVLAARAAPKWGPSIAPPAQPPFRIGATSTSPFAAVVWAGRTEPDTAQVVMYVRETCPYCHAELRHWLELTRTSSSLVGAIEFVVISADSGTSQGAGLVPVGLPHRRLYDTMGRIGRELGVSAVPYTLYIDAAGTVRANSLGESGVAAIASHLAILGTGGLE